MAVRTVVHFEIPAKDVEALSRFYTQAFGWKFEKVPSPTFDYWLISTGPRGKSVGGGMYKKMGETDWPRNYVGVDDIDSAIETFMKAGGHQAVGKQEVQGQGWSFIGTDPEGNTIALWQQLKPQRPTRRRTPKRKKRKSRRS